MKRTVRWILAFAALAALVALVVWAYLYVSPMTPQASEDWSRGRVIGRTTVNLPAALQAAPDGDVFVVWPNVDSQLQLVHIGGDGRMVENRVLQLEGGAARVPQLQVDAQGRLHLLWRSEDESRSSIRYALLASDGTPLWESGDLSDPADSASDAPKLVLDEEGRPHALWTDGRGIWWTSLDPAGESVEEATLLVADAHTPAVQVDTRGRICLAWQRQLGSNAVGLYYAVLDPESGSLSQMEEMYQVYLRFGQRIDGPMLGLDAETGYMLWVLDDARELSSTGMYAFFPLGVPRQKRVKEMELTEGANPTGVYPLSGQHTSLLVALSETVPDPEQGFLPQVAVLTLVQDEMPEYETWGLTRRKGGGQWALLAQVRPAGKALGWEGEHVVTASDRPSINPALAVDDQSDLHVVWLETAGFGEYRVVYASNAQEVVQAYNAVRLWDVVDKVFGGIVQLSVVVLTAGPMLALWAVVPLLGLVVYHIVTGEEGLEMAHSWIMLIAMLAIEIGLTMLLPPRRAVPWPPLRWVAPFATALIAVIPTVFLLRRKGESLLFTAFFLFTAVHSLLQLALYTLL